MSDKEVAHRYISSRPGRSYRLQEGALHDERTDYNHSSRVKGNNHTQIEDYHVHHYNRRLLASVCRKKVKPWFGRLRLCASISPSIPRLKKSRSERSQIFDPSLKAISMREIAKATDNFSPRKLIGDGGFGFVYKATLSDGRIVAVKTLVADGIQGKREFEAEMSTLGHIKHPNLVELLAFCKAGDDRALVYEYIANGSLDTWLHEREDGPRLLTWERRIKLAHGTAKVLAYLHHEYEPHVIHRDIKSSNILVGKDFEAKLADFGLARHMSPLLSHVSTEAAGTLGYVAPECNMTMSASRKSDVYSFGVLMLELVSGCRPNTAPENSKCGTLVKWTHYAIASGKQMDTIDPVLKERGPPFKELTTFLKIASLCTSDSPDNRPTMKEALQQLSQLRTEIAQVRNHTE
ncbi:hypothetical protein KP509_30G031400 [Ceratopteris richardii]|uniref:non-specific serine/threonine protein kinase n=1 Tax=Ceratopteris richardii TaxID=49495 RepID=A0A8T2R1C4_CERRI|nr:hypothetical protein KP509_30G031400 [Ceratopteris richardii]